MWSRKDFSFDSQLPVPKIVKESDSQLASLKNRQTPDSTSLSRKTFRSTPNFQLSVPKIVRESDSQLQSLKNRQTPNSDPTPHPCN